DDQGIEQAETNGRHDEQIHGGDLRRVITQESPPSLAWRPTSFDHVLGNARLRHLKSELKQLTMNARRSPKRVFHAHLPDQGAQLRADLRPPSPRAGSPTPIAAKAGSMPTNNGLRLNDSEHSSDRRKPMVKLDQE